MEHSIPRWIQPWGVGGWAGAVAVFVGVALGFSWLTWLPLVFAGPTTVMPWFFYLGSMGPALGAIAATIVLRPDGGVGAWARRTFSVTGTGRALVVVVVSLALYVGVGLLVEQVATGSIARLPSVGLTTQVPGAWAVLVAVIWVVTFGLGQETGWRGWLIPMLTGRFGFFAAGFMVAGVWLEWLARIGRWSIAPVVLWPGGFDFLTSSDLGPSTFPPRSAP